MVIVMRGVSGSGKTTYRERHYPEARVASADLFHMDEKGVYNWRADKQGDAHNFCLRTFSTLVSTSGNNDRPIVVDNTNTTVDEMLPYVRLAQAWGHDVQIITLDVPVDIAFARNQHNVPFEAAKRQRENMDRNAERIPKKWNHTIIPYAP